MYRESVTLSQESGSEPMRITGLQSLMTPNCDNIQDIITDDDVPQNQPPDTPISDVMNIKL